MTKKSKYIDRAALFNSLANVKTIGEVFAAIQDAPAADVEEVRHGRWEDKGSLSCRCSECGCKANKETAYCPNCGSRMDGEDE